MNMRRCFGINRNFHRCSRKGKWRFFCSDHSRQPLIWLSFLLFTVLGSIASMQSAWWRKQAPINTHSPYFKIDMTITYPGYFRLLLVNKGRAVTEDGYIEVVSWADGAPAEDLRIRQNFPKLLPQMDWTYDVDLFEARRQHSGNDIKLPRSPISGYIVVSCSNCDKPQGWAFHIPGKNQDWQLSTDLGHVPLTAFQYPLEKPSIGTHLNTPGWKENSGE